MNTWEYPPRNDEEMEALMREGASALPPDGGLVAEITPWRRAMNRALLGIALNLFTLNFWHLNFLLPAVGNLMLLLGFRALRRENRGFTACWYISVLQAAVRYGVLILDATVWQFELHQLPFMQALPYLMTVLSFAQIVSLRAGFRAARQKTGLPPAAPGTMALAVWFLLISILALASYTGVVLAWGLIIAYFIILRALWKLPRQLEAAGYAIKPASVRLSDGALGIAVFSVLLLGLACAYLFAGSYSMDWTPASPDGQAGLEELRTELLDLGFPKAVLNDLTAEELSACQGAVRVVVEQKDFPVNEGRIVVRKEGATTHHTREYDVKELRITGVAVELPGGRERWRVIHHFEWVADPGFHGTEALQFWTADSSDGWSMSGEPAGRLLYDRDGQTYTAPYHYFGEENYQQDTMFWGTQQKHDLFAAFSFPRAGERQRGYVLYDILENEDGWIIDSWINYVHQRSWFQYPVRTAMEDRMRGGWNISGPFCTVQTAIQFNPSAPEYPSEYQYSIIAD